MAIRRPRFKKQIGDPTTNLDPYICTLESGAMGLDVLTGGRIDVWGGNLVPYCGRSPYAITKLGTNLGNVQLAWKHWGKTLDRRRGYTWNNALADLKNGYWVIIQGDYDQFSLFTRCQDDFRGDHAVLAGPEFLKSGSILMADPLCSTFKYVSQVELRNYANKLGKKIYGTRWRGQIFYARIKPAVIPTMWGSGVPLNIRAVDPTGKKVAAAVKEAGHNYGAVVDMADLEAAMKKVGHNYGTTVDPSDVKWLLDWAAKH